MTRPSSEFFESSSIQSSDERIEASQLGRANIYARNARSSVQSFRKASLAAETTGGVILVAFVLT